MFPVNVAAENSAVPCPTTLKPKFGIFTVSPPTSTATVGTVISDHQVLAPDAGGAFVDPATSRQLNTL